MLPRWITVRVYTRGPLRSLTCAMPLNETETYESLYQQNHSSPNEL